MASQNKPLHAQSAAVRVWVFFLSSGLPLSKNILEWSRAWCKNRFSTQIDSALSGLWSLLVVLLLLFEALYVLVWAVPPAAPESPLSVSACTSQLNPVALRQGPFAHSIILNATFYFIFEFFK